jgi:uncharacterized protein YukE
MMPSSHASHDTVCGVDRRIVERFLGLIRDNYPKADRAMFFLEERAGVTHTVAITNLRDVLSHLSTLLQKDTDPQRLEDQVVHAEEHFRRAIQEPYAIALGSRREAYKPVYERYIKIFGYIRRAQKRGLFGGAPTQEAVEQRIQRISALASEGRSGKLHNQTDDIWDQAVANYGKAYDDLSSLMDQLSTHIHEFEATRHSQVGKRWTIVSTILSIVFGVTSLLLLLNPLLTQHIRAFLGILP